MHEDRRQEPGPSATPLARRQRRELGLLILAALITLVGLVTAALTAEHTAATPLVQIGQRAPAFSLPSSHGGSASLPARGRPLLLVFTPSVICGWCQAELRTIHRLLPDLRARGLGVSVISVDTPAVQRAAASSLGLSYPLLSEAPAAAAHPAGSAYGVYQRNGAPVDSNTAFVIDAQGIVRGVRTQPGSPFSSTQLLQFVDRSIRQQGSGG